MIIPKLVEPYYDDVLQGLGQTVTMLCITSVGVDSMSPTSRLGKYEARLPRAKGRGAKVDAARPGILYRR